MDHTDSAPAPDSGKSADPDTESVPESVPVDDAFDVMGGFRPITVMMVDLVGSTDITNDYDDEESQEIILKFRDVVSNTVQPMGGYVDRAFGDALLVAFGHPVAREDDPERAVRAALATHAALRDFEQLDGIGYKAHIGIATNRVLIGQGEHRENLKSDEYFGKVPILATRLQDETDPGETMICELTHERVSGLFRFEKLPGRVLKKFRYPVDIYRLLGEASGADHEDQPHRRHKGRFVGRKDQLDRLMSCWEEVREHGSHVVSVSGDAGIGKSRLLSEHRNHPALGRHATVIYKCLRHYENTPFFPFLTQVESWLRIHSQDSTEVRLEKLHSGMSELLSGVELDVLSAVLVSTPKGERFLNEMPADAFKAHAINAFVQPLKQLAKQSPVLLNIEDVHWIDPSSRQLLETALPMLEDLPVMVVVSHRAEMPTFLQRPNTTQIELTELPDALARELVMGLPDAEDLDRHSIARIVRVTNGVPLFIEHYTGTVLNGDLRVGTLPPADEPAKIPDQIYGMLFAQLDDAGPDRGVALAATAIGRPFDARLLAAAAGMGLEETQAVIDRLLERGLLIEARSGTELPYRFNHVMVQDAGYRSMVTRQRKMLHQRIAQHLSDDRPELADRDPELLARQFREAGISDRAIVMSLSAGQRALSRFANNAAIQHAMRGLSLLTELPREDRPEQEMKLRFLLGLANSAESGFGSPETLDGFQKAYDLAQKIGDDKIYLRSAQGLFAAFHAHANYRGAEEIGEQLQLNIRSRPAGTAPPHAKAVADQIIGSALIWQGDFLKARRMLRQAMGLSDTGSGDQPTEIPAGASSQTIASLALVEAFLGNAQNAANLSRAAIAAARTSGSPMSIGNAMLMACNVHQILRHEDAHAMAEALEAYGREQRIPFYEHGARSFRGVALYQDQDRVAEGYETLMEAWPKFQGTTARANQVFVCVEQAEGLRLMGKLPEAMAAIEKGLALAEEYGELNFKAELHRLKGVLLIETGGNSDESLGEIERALGIASDQSSKLFQLRALTELAAHAVRGRAEDQHIDRLHAFLSKYGPGDRSRDVEVAREVLLSAGPRDL